MNRKAEILYRLGEYFGGGMFERENDSIAERYALGIRRYFEHAEPPPESGPLYPAPEHKIWQLNGTFIRWHYAFSLDVDAGGLRSSGQSALTDPFELDMLECIIRELQFFRTSLIAPSHGIGGRGWTHTVLNYPRMLAEGLAGYIARVEEMPAGSLKRALQDTLAGITSFLDRAPGSIREEVMRPAGDFHHAMRSFNFFFALDSYDSAGRFDEYMGRYYQGEPDAFELVHELFRSMELHCGWHLLYTGLYPEFTVLCLKAQKGLFRPNSGLLIRQDTPQEIWDAVLDLWSSGVPNPALYYGKAYLESLAYYGADWQEAAPELLAFGGCTETMLAGCSNIGSTEGGINLLELLARNGEGDYRESIRREVETLASEFRMESEFAAKFRPHLIRTLFVDDCIDRNLEFNAGGARYNGSVCNVAGLTNAVNSLAAMQGIPEKFGNGDDRVDVIARDLAEYTFDLIRQQKGRLGGVMFPAVILLNHFVAVGSWVDATPDGRAAGEPVADSIGPVAGTDRNGPTAMLRSAAGLPLRMAAGTPVLNLRLRKDHIQNSPAQVKALIEGFFALGGMQLQVTVADQELLRKAYEHPEAYPGVFVRIGGFSARFRDLGREQQRDILRRTEYGNA